MGYFPVLNTKKNTSTMKKIKTKLPTKMPKKMASDNDGDEPQMNKPKMHTTKHKPLAKNSTSSIVKKMTMGKKKGM